jgi:hypothetical protein
MVVDGVVVQPEEYVLVVQVGENDERLQAARVGNGRRLVASMAARRLETLTSATAQMLTT